MCQVAGIFLSADSREDAVTIFTEIAKKQKNRGNKGAGILTYTHNRPGYTSYCKDVGPVAEVFTPEICQRLSGQVGIVQGRYATDGHTTSILNVQPLFYEEDGGSGGIAHNGTLLNKPMRVMPEASDTWNIVWGFADDHRLTIMNRFKAALKKVHGSYCVVMVYQDKDGELHLLAARDYWGFHPLFIGVIGEEGWVIASETEGLKEVGAKQIRMVERGEVIHVTTKGLDSSFLQEKPPHGCAECIFERVYFASHEGEDSCPNGMVSIGDYRVGLGKRLWQEVAAHFAGEHVDCIVPIPKSAILHAQGVSEASGIPIQHLVMRKKGVDVRTWMMDEARMDDASMIDEAIDRKFNFHVKGIERVQRIILVDDSLVRGNTMRRIVQRLKAINPTVHIFILLAFPANIAPCFHGLAMPTIKELAWHKYGKSAAGIAQALGVAGIYYLSREGLLETCNAVSGRSDDEWCQQCYGGILPSGVKLHRPDYKAEWQDFLKTQSA